MKDFHVIRLHQKRKEAFSKYRKEVQALTEDQPIYKLKNSNKRGFKNYHLDHIVPIDYGFKMGIPVEVIAHIDNLRFIPYKENMRKGRTLIDKKVIYNLMESIMFKLNMISG